MNPPSSRLTQNSATEHVHATQGETVREFATPEELLRHDRAQTEVPPALAERLGETIAAEPKPAAAKPWWKRIL
jgi:hypothetical protein